jgi:hypothetical protein
MRAHAQRQRAEHPLCHWDPVRPADQHPGHRKLLGTTIVLRITQGGKTTTRSVKLR